MRNRHDGSGRDPAVAPPSTTRRAGWVAGAVVCLAATARAGDASGEAGEEAPAAEVKAPAAEVKASAAEVKASAAEVKAPAADVKAPAAETKAPAPGGSKSDAPTSAAATGPASGDAAEARDLRSAVEGLLGAPVHGRFSLAYQARFTTGDEDTDETDQDLLSYLDVRVGDERRDGLSANVYVRTAWDLDRGHDTDGRGYEFSSLADTFDHEFTALLHTAYGTWRPKSDVVEYVRFGRQYEATHDTFHFDGATVVSRPLVKEIGLRLKAYGGVPVHFYESSPSGDLLAGIQAAAEPVKGTRVAVDYARVEDELAGYDEERNDLGAVQVWQRLAAHADVHGRFTWLDGPSDASLRATWDVADLDLLVQGSYYELFDTRERLATEIDPYYDTLHELSEYRVAELRAVKGLGEDWQVEIGGYLRDLDESDDESDYNRNTHRFWITPSVDGLPWEGSTLSAGVEVWTGDGERTETWTADLSHRFSKDVRASIGTDYALYAFGPLQDGERDHVRTVYVRTVAKLTDELTLDFRYTWERDEEETYHVLSMALALDF